MAANWNEGLPTPQPASNGNGHVALNGLPGEPPHGISFGAMKAQATQADARAERLIRQVRGEVDELRGLLDVLHDNQHEITTIDLQAFLRNPQAATQLPAALLVRTLVRAAEHLDHLEADLSKARDEAHAWERQVYELREERAGLRARNETFADVAAALHANLEDLRFARDTLRELPRATIHPALNAGQDR